MAGPEVPKPLSSEDIVKAFNTDDPNLVIRRVAFGAVKGESLSSLQRQVAVWAFEQVWRRDPPDLADDALDTIFFTNLQISSEKP